MKRYSILLLTASITLAGCQTTEIVPPKSIAEVNYADMPILLISLDSDGDGVPDDLDQCPETPTNVVVDESGCPVSVDILMYEGVEARVFFPENSSEPIASSYRGFDKFGEYLRNNNKEFLIEGHISTHEKNSGSDTLATTRAEFIKNYIVLNYGINPKRFKVIGRNDTQPIASNDDPEDRKKNQRVYVTENRWSNTDD
ncbi:OmpA family protein [Psychrobacter sp. DAB_AL62B]|uniref:OmpA family protein n=1 Tax=Psychrobacter sp. DAB_AL62B TaxID=1028420 RepID=UPI002380D8D7|nr:OmpA family protein [Psychrobacter sp. DAB_AL62B]MDE4455164.1 OmpA family protein [Psychrobacter sp. DAB_AL62B]